MRRHIAFIAVVFLLCALAPAGVLAGTFCAGSSAALLSGLASGQVQNGSATYELRIVQGVYAVPAMGTDFSAPTVVSGGWNANCTQQTPGYAATVIDVGGQDNFIFQQWAGEFFARLTVSDLTFRNVGNLDLIAGSNGFSLNSGELTIERVRVTAARSFRPTAHDGQLWLRNVLFDHQVGQDISCPVRVVGNYSYVSVNHVTADIGAGKAFCVYGNGGDRNIDIYNTIVWGSDGGQPAIMGIDVAHNPVNLVSDAFNAYLSADGPATIVAQVNANPAWISPTIGNYRLNANSPAINHGSNGAPGGVPTGDAEGNARWIGSKPDIGAFESATNDVAVLTVTNANDSGPGSLRQAMLDANSPPLQARIIRFQILNSNSQPLCPAVIALNSALPAIAAPMLIDGYSQGGSSPNTDAAVFNATLCTVIQPASGTLASGFAVQAGVSAQVQLNLRGVAMGGFNQGVLLLGGGNHVITGNQFGGKVGALNLPGFKLNVISVGAGVGGALTIGGQSAAARNVIGGAIASGLGYGVSIQSAVAGVGNNCQIVNNLIGLDRNGITANGSDIGVQIDGSDCALIGNRIAGNLGDAVVLGGARNVVQRNQIGLDVNGNGFVNSGYGVRVTGGNSNVIGAAAQGAISGALLANTIRRMVKGGVAITGAATTVGNAVRGNFIHDNGVSGAGFDIDLGPAGPTANDPGDADLGPNNLQNFPVISQLYWSDWTGVPTSGSSVIPVVLAGVLDTQPGVYRIDAYLSTRCDNAVNGAPGRGHAEQYIGGMAATITPGSAGGRFYLTATLPGIGANDVISLTATDVSGNTSEIGSCYLDLTANSIGDVIFQGGFNAP